MSSPTSNLGDQIYSGTAELGQFRTTVGLFIGSIIGIIFIIVGIYMLTKQNTHTEKVQAKVESLVNPCTSNNNQKMINCNLTISYTYKNILYKPLTVLRTIDGFHNIGDLISIYIDPNNPSDFSQESKQSDTVIGWIIIGFATFFILASILSWWLARRYKLFAAFEGASMGVNLISGRNMF